MKGNIENTKKSENEFSRTIANANADKENQEIIDSYDYLSNAASSQDCTGLIPSNPASVEELEAYEELYHFLPPNSRASSLKED